ncbi:hypothetical protein MKEN_00101000 [Mycena kentingensis (nom. inval.)]|nr:hypothetical protein MKEN_00101000 [Mycena kentingensis (nom. inval.)]
MSSPKRVLTDDARAANVYNPHPSTPADLTLALQNVGSRVRKHVNQGYATQRRSSAPPSPTRSSPAIFTPAFDTLRTVMASAPPAAPRRLKRPFDDDDTVSDTEDRDMAVDVGPRPIKPKPRRLQQTQSLPANLFGLPDHSAEDDWSVEMTSQPTSIDPSAP